ncbi:restriction endonuclease subunit S [Vibrio sp. YMD68]|uniref:restriction endonuclease subunit S n=1 Tax=Vibrio sp. YMD68 TaxID=3042300 RepID=UPI00249C3E48|nr:restriction endonuclease subunit S [Vibrio sp. YMD68]WGW00135.1 restriction endonuclease subunit S [Vibrio sp. YMD68]
MSFDNLPRDWQLIPLEDAMDAIIDYRGKTPKKTESGIPLITAKIVKGGYVLEPFEFIAEDNYDSWMVRGLPQVGDVVLTTEAPLGETAQLTSANVALAQRIVTLRGKKGLLDSDFLLCALQSDFVQHQLESRASGSTVKGIKQSELRKVILPIPPLLEQHKISQVLKSLSNKLVCNTKTNQTLEEMAQAIFKSWFVDFEPVKAKMNGEQPEGMDAATASLFPEKLVESELGLIPEGWSVESAKSQLDVLRGFSYKGKGLVTSLDQGVPMHNLNSVLEGGGYKYKGLKFYSDEFKDKFLVQEGDVLVANTEQGHNHLLIGYGAMIPKHLAFGFCSHHTYRVRPKSDSNVTPEFIERLFGKGRFVKQVQGFTNGTTVNMLPVAGMEMPEFVVPPRTLAEKYSELVKPMKAMIEENHKSNIELAKLRDTLLPKLLSGEIELEATEELVEVN